MTDFVKSRARHLTIVGVLLVATLIAVIAGARGTAADAPPAAPPPPEVAVITVAAESTPVYHEYPARTYARDLVEVRGRVDGYIEKRTFAIGSDVAAGQVLYVLDKRPYEAEVERLRGALAQATADIAQADANLSKAQQDVDRLKPLVQDQAAARQDLDNALTAVRASQAAVESRRATLEAAKAALRTADLNLEYATIRAPVSGRIGDSLLQVGGLVSRTSAEPLTTIAPLDTIWVRFQVSEAELPLFASADSRALPIELLLNGTTRITGGRVQNTLNGVNTRTGTMEVQASFANAAHAILPGQFGRVRIRVEERANAILVPQKAVQEVQGLQSVLVVGADRKVQSRPVVTGSRVDERWIVEQGLAPGDTVIVEGVQKARPGSVVTTKPYGAPAQVASASSIGR